MRRAMSFLAIAALVLFGCARSTGRRSTVSFGPDEQVLWVEQTGGFLPPQEILRQVPMMALYGDGRMFTPGPMIEIYPPPSLLGFTTRTLSNDQLLQVLADAKQAGLTGGDRVVAENRIADAPTTIIVVNDGKRTHRTEFQALNETENSDATAARQFIEKVSQIEGGRDETTEIERLQVISYPPVEAPNEIDPGKSDWPLSKPLSEFGEPFSMRGLDARCGEVEPADLETMLEAAGESNTLTRWQSGGTEYALAFQPLLPGEEPCRV